MKGFKFLGNKQMRLEEVPKPKASGTEVVIRVRAAALCGTDLPYYGAPPEKTLQSIPGHEISGEIAEVDAAEHFKVGDRVALSTQVGCGHCDYCRQGEYLFCPQHRVFGVSPGLHGGHGEYVLAPERACLPLPDGISFDVGAILPDALGVAFHAVRRIGGVGGREKTLVLGTGPIGLGVILLLKYYGAFVIASDVRPYRLDLAKSLGTDVVVNPREQTLLDAVKRLTGGSGVDVAFDCAANTGETVVSALDSVKRAGTVVLIGQKESATINPNWHVVWRQTRIFGSCAFNIGEWGDMMRVVQDGLPIDRLITHRFPFEETPKAFEVFDQGNTGKVVVLHDPDSQ